MIFKQDRTPSESLIKEGLIEKILEHLPKEILMTYLKMNSTQSSMFC
jgi:hypothetical protein